jgi:hypothetical protein
MFATYGARLDRWVAASDKRHGRQCHFSSNPKQPVDTCLCLASAMLQTLCLLSYGTTAVSTINNYLSPPQV